VNFFHFGLVLCNELLGWEFTLWQTIVSLNVFDIRVGNLAPVELKVFMGFLNNDRGRCVRIIFCLQDRMLSIKLSHFLNHSDKEAAGVLMMRHYSETFGQFIED